MAATNRLKLVWPLALLLGLAVLAAGGLLWALMVASENETLAARKRLEEAYGGYAEAGRAALDTSWHELAATLQEVASESPPSAHFAAIVRELGPEINSVIVDGNGNDPPYPALLAPNAGLLILQDSRWPTVEQLEFSKNNDLPQALTGYESIASDAMAARRWSESALARQAEIRCLLKLGRRETALAKCREMLGNSHLAESIDRSGRSVAANTAFALFEVCRENGDPEASEVAARLVGMVNDYRTGKMPAAQRRFLMTALKDAGQGEFPTLAAENVAARWLELAGASGDELFAWKDEKSGIRLLFTREKLKHRGATVLGGVTRPAHARLLLRDAGTPKSDTIIASAEAGATLPGWRIDIAVEEAAMAQLAGRHVALYTVVGAGVVAILGLLTWLIFHGMLNQLRGAQLKHDLAATISHELRTPLASMRVLVDLLQEGDRIDEVQAREYLGIISAENERLSQLVENFLTCARIEKGSVADMEKVAPGDLIRETAGAMKRRYPDRRIEVEIEPSLPEIRTDAGALKTALINLADNACKYSPLDQPVSLRGISGEVGELRFEVADHGAGLSSRELDRAFAAFQQLNRGESSGLKTGAGSGCGLGLYIVRQLVERIGARLDVSSQPGEGSRFSILVRPAIEREN